MSNRYEISDQGDGTAIVIDTESCLPIFTTDGTHIYEAPIANAQWTADRLNRAEVRMLDSLARIAVAIEEAEAEPTRPPNSLDRAQAQRQRIQAARERRETESAPVVQSVEKVDYPRMAGKAIGSLGVLAGRLNSIGRWLDALEDGSVSAEFAMAQLRKAQLEAYQYAEDIYEELSAR